MPYFPSAPGGSVLLPNTIDDAMLVDMPAGTVKGRALGAGTGDPTNLTTAQLWALLSNPVFTNCRLDAVSTSVLRLSRFNGYLLTIDNQPQVIPAAGVDLAPTGLTVGSVYYIYAFMNAGVMTLIANNSVPAIDPRNGLKIANGNPLLTLVGMVRVAAGPGFHTESYIIGTLSYFNRRQRIGTGPQLAGAQSSSTSLVVASAYAVYIINWAEELPLAMINGYSTNSIVGGVNLTYILQDGSAPASPAQLWASFANAGGPHAHSVFLGASEGVFHVIAPGLQVSGGVGTWSGNVAVVTMG